MVIKRRFLCGVQNTIYDRMIWCDMIYDMEKIYDFITNSLNHNSLSTTMKNSSSVISYHHQDFIINSVERFVFLVRSRMLNFEESFGSHKYGHHPLRNGTWFLLGPNCGWGFICSKFVCKREETARLLSCMERFLFCHVNERVNKTDTFAEKSYLLYDP